MTTRPQNFVLLLLALAVALSGCAAGQRGRGKPAGIAFFGADAKLLKEGGSEDWALHYRNPNIDFRSYDKAMLDPIGIWADADSHLRKVSATDRQRIANNFYVLMHKTLARYFTMVDEPGPGTLRMKAALTNAEASSRTLDTLSSVVPQMRMTTTLVGYVTGKPAFTGEAAFAFKVSDAETGETLAMGADKRVGTKTISGSTDSWSDVNDALEYWAKLATYRICTEKKLSNCEKPSPKRGI